MPRFIKLFSLLKGLIKSDFQTTAGLMGEMHGLPQKLGQHFTLYPGHEYQEYFERLCTEGRQEQLPMDRILRDLGLNPDKAGICAQASIGQVYRVETDTGELAVKVRYPGIEKRIRADFNLLKILLWPFRLTPIRNNALIPVLENLRVTLLQECDYEKEAQAQNSFSRFFAEEGSVLVPELIAYNKNAIVTRWINGQTLTQRKTGLGGWFIESYLQFFIKSLKHLKMVHADPHPGNFMITGQDSGTAGEGQNSQQLAVLDFGSVIRFNEIEAGAVLRLLLGEYPDEDALIRDLIILGVDGQTIDTYRYIIGDLAAILLEPFYYQGRYEFFNWRLQYKMNTLLGSRTWERPLLVPPHLLLLLRTLQGMYYYARVNFISFNWHEAIRKYMR